MARKPKKAEPTLFEDLDLAHPTPVRKRARVAALPGTVQPLFLPELIDKAAKDIGARSGREEAHEVFKTWRGKLRDGTLDALNEIQVEGEFAGKLLHALGYRSPIDVAEGDPWTMQAKWSIPGVGIADVAMGRFHKEAGKLDGEPVVVVEVERTNKDLDRKESSGRSPVQQAWDYLNGIESARWAIVSNYVEIRLYCKARTSRHLHRVALDDLDDPQKFAEFYAVFQADRLLGTGAVSLNADKILKETSEKQESVSDELYRHYSAQRDDLIRVIQSKTGADLDRAIRAAQRLLDRILFIAFAEDRDLLRDRHMLDGAAAVKVPGLSRWRAFQLLFRAIDEGDALNEVPKYNGSLFKRDDILDDPGFSLDPDDPNGVDRWTTAFKTFGQFDFRYEVTVDVLGRIFEQSINDIEKIKAEGLDDPAPAKPDRKRPGQRKLHGVFYTDAAITDYLVDAALRPSYEEHRARLSAHEPSPDTSSGGGNGDWLRVREVPVPFSPEAGHAGESPANAVDVSEAATGKGGQAPRSTSEPVPFPSLETASHATPEPGAPPSASLTRGLLDWLGGLTVCDPACGSGAFLNAAYNWLEDRRIELLKDLHDAEPDAPECAGEVEDWRARAAVAILRDNLFGVDLSPESVEIAQLSLWVRTARRGQPLTDLSTNVVCGNSVVDDPSVDPRAFDWKARFPAVFDRGGFDAVVGNPPYVRQERLGPIKTHLEASYRAYHGMADLYVYFYERGMSLLKPGGRLAYVVTNKWMKAGYGEPLRRYFAEQTWVESVIDFGHAKQFFKDADVFPCFLVVRKPSELYHRTKPRASIIVGDRIRLDAIRTHVEEHWFEVEKERFDAAEWQIEPRGITDLFAKIRACGMPLSDFAGVKPLSGIKTAYNEAFLIDAATRNRLVSSDPNATNLIKPYVRGADISRWNVDWTNSWMIAMKSSGDHPWPWAEEGDRAEDIFRLTYPSIYEFMKGHEVALRNRQDKGRFWWELRSCAYWDEFQKEKIFYQLIQFHPWFAIDSEGLLGNNKTTFIPKTNYYLLAVLNSPLMWWHNWRYLPHMKDEALAPNPNVMESCPIASTMETPRLEIEIAARRLVDISQARNSTAYQFLDWLKVQHDVTTPNQRLQNPIALTSDEFIAEVVKSRGKSKSLSPAGLKDLRGQYVETIEPARGLAAEALGLEGRVNDLVNEAYGLTPEEVRLMWDTAPPRMPIPRPNSLG